MSSSNPIPKMDSKTAELIQQMMSNSSSSHSQVKQISPTSYQGKSVSPSSLYNKSSPQATLSPQTWSVASLLSNTAPGMISPSLSNPAPGYQTLKLSNFTRDSPASPSIHPPSVVSPGDVKIKQIHLYVNLQFIVFVDWPSVHKIELLIAMIMSRAKFGRRIYLLTLWE